MLSLDTDIDALTIEGITPSCEHPRHSESPVHTDGDEHYIRLRLSCGHHGGQIRVACLEWLAFVHMDGEMGCSECGALVPAGEAIEDLGPVTNYH